MKAALEDGHCFKIYVDVLGTTHESKSIVAHASDSEDAEAIGTLDRQIAVGDNAVIPANGRDPSAS